MRARNVMFGLALVALYLVAVSATTAFRRDDARPLYDGFTPPPSYRFVDPPPFFASGNVKPEAMSTSIALGPDGSAPAGFSTPDGQFVVSLGRGAIAPHEGATTVAVRITPLAPRNLGAVPDGLRPNGNAYRVEMTYEPVDVSVTRFAQPGTLLIELPELGPALFVSTDAKTWSQLSSRAIPPRELSLSANFAAPGYYLAVTSLPELATQPGRSRHTAEVLGIATTVFAIAMFAGVYIFVIRRRRHVAPESP